MRSALKDVSGKIADHIKDAGSIRVVIDSALLPALSPSQRKKLVGLKDMTTCVFHPGGHSKSYCSGLASLPQGLARYPLAQT